MGVIAFATSGQSGIAAELGTDESAPATMVEAESERVRVAVTQYGEPVIRRRSLEPWNDRDMTQISRRKTRAIWKLSVNVTNRTDVPDNRATAGMVG
jgi:hypothetical protein